MSNETCGNCGADTENEPLVLCDECNNEPDVAPDALRSERDALQKRVADLKFALGDGAGWFDRFKSVEAQLAAVTKERDEARDRMRSFDLVVSAAKLCAAEAREKRLREHVEFVAAAMEENTLKYRLRAALADTATEGSKRDTVPCEHKQVEDAACIDCGSVLGSDQ